MFRSAHYPLPFQKEVVAVHTEVQLDPESPESLMPLGPGTFLGSVVIPLALSIPYMAPDLWLIILLI